MSPQSLRDSFKRLVFGRSLLPQEFTIGLDEPQAEVSIWLHGLGPPRDVTRRFTTACTAPLTLCIGFDTHERREAADFRGALLEFREQAGAGRVLGKIRLDLDTVLSVAGLDVFVFRVRASANYCLPRARLWSHYLLHAYSHWRRNDPEDIRMTFIEERAACVTFIRPHFLYLVSLGDDKAGNMFPMNLVGELGGRYIGLALREKRAAAHLVERAGRMALSGVPLQQCPVTFQLFGNHKRERIGWDELPFPTKPSSTFGIPVPSFATRLRELQVELVRGMGSHRFFVARSVSDESYARRRQVCIIHGFYQYWRLKGQPELLAASVADDVINKRG